MTSINGPTPSIQLKAVHTIDNQVLITAVQDGKSRTYVGNKESEWASLNSALCTLLGKPVASELHSWHSADAPNGVLLVDIDGHSFSDFFEASNPIHKCAEAVIGLANMMANQTRTDFGWVPA